MTKLMPLLFRDPIFLAAFGLFAYFAVVSLAASGPAPAGASASTSPVGSAPSSPPSPTPAAPVGAASILNVRSPSAVAIAPRAAGSPRTFTIDALGGAGADAKTFAEIASNLQTDDEILFRDGVYPFHLKTNLSGLRIGAAPGAEGHVRLVGEAKFPLLELGDGAAVELEDVSFTWDSARPMIEASEGKFLSLKRVVGTAVAGTLFSIHETEARLDQVTVSTDAPGARAELQFGDSKVQIVHSVFTNADFLFGPDSHAHFLSTELKNLRAFIVSRDSDARVVRSRFEGEPSANASAAGEVRVGHRAKVNFEDTETSGLAGFAMDAGHIEFWNPKTAAPARGRWQADATSTIRWNGTLLNDPNRIELNFPKKGP